MKMNLRYRKIAAMVLLVVGAWWGYSAYTRAQEEKARKAKIKALTGEFIKVKAGTFMMGCTPEQSDCDSDENAHRVTLTQDYLMGKYEVTQAHWRKVMGSDPVDGDESWQKTTSPNCDNCPVERVSWDDIQEFLVKLNEQTATKGTSKRYRLPTEAEWEYAARGGHKANSTKYAGGNNIGSVAWYDDNSGYKTHPVGQKAANELGLYDMTGNVWEWCSDRYGEDYYSSGARTDPKGPSSGRNRVLRGDSWSNYGAGYCRVSYRNGTAPVFRSYSFGFRLCLSL